MKNREKYAEEILNVACAGITYTPNEVVIESIRYCAWCGKKLDWSEIDEIE